MLNCAGIGWDIEFFSSNLVTIRSHGIAALAVSHRGGGCEIEKEIIRMYEKNTKNRTGLHSEKANM